jgi:hypothetical protein
LGATSDKPPQAGRQALNNAEGPRLFAPNLDLSICHSGASEILHPVETRQGVGTRIQQNRVTEG